MDMKPFIHEKYKIQITLRIQKIVNTINKMYKKLFNRHGKI